eukprot:GHVN01097240.1.p2 GENE.GHVN01097240.1~~GHVN01097240.1.p2  ORF type:complete len:357 (-),score=72.68 GHVN01097240.1:2112-3182(-)
MGDMGHLGEEDYEQVICSGVGEADWEDALVISCESEQASSPEVPTESCDVGFLSDMSLTAESNGGKVSGVPRCVRQKGELHESPPQLSISTVSSNSWTSLQSPSPQRSASTDDQSPDSSLGASMLSDTSKRQPAQSPTPMSDPAIKDRSGSLCRVEIDRLARANALNRCNSVYGAAKLDERLLSEQLRRVSSMAVGWPSCVVEHLHSPEKLLQLALPECSFIDIRMKTDLRLRSGAAMIPHPDKEAYGGDDAFFISTEGVAIGVADGVGEWNSLGLNPRMFAEELMEGCRNSVEVELISESGSIGLAELKPHVLKVLQRGQDNAKHYGSSTALITEHALIPPGGTFRSCVWSVGYR